MTDEEYDAWAATVLDRIRLHRRREVSGMLAMLDADLVDFLDLLAVAPLLEAEEHEWSARAGYERQRAERLERYEPDWARIVREDGFEGCPHGRHRPDA